MNRRGHLLDHAILIAGTFIMCLPLWLTLVAATRDGTLGLLPGDALLRNIENLLRALDAVGPSLSGMLLTSAVSAFAVGLVTVVASFMAAFAMVFCRNFVWVFWLSLGTLYFPIEARMIPTFDVAARLGLLDTFAGLVLPIVPLAVGTFAFRQNFKVLGPELMAAARLDGAGPLRFLIDFAVPLSLPIIGAVFAIAFVLGWNQYLWPLLVSVDNTQFTLMRGFGVMPNWSGARYTMAAVSLLPPLLLVGLALALWGRRWSS